MSANRPGGRTPHGSADQRAGGQAGGQMEREDRDTAFTDFVTSRSRALLSSAYLLTGDLQRGEDLTQTALLKAYLAWPRLREPAAAEAYVRRIMVTTSISWWRRRWRGEVPSAELPDRARLDTSELVDGRSEMWPHLLALPARQRVTLVLRYYEDLPLAQVAELMGCSLGTVKSTTNRALAALRARIEAADHVTPGGVR
jgi:RNA polymerase sigma-70 factor (sigma-E family)